jgi:REP element-mobilizing transposase RayT
MRYVRNKDPKIVRLITIRTVESRIWIPANAKTKRLIGGILGRYQEIYGIEIFAYAILGNHYHLLLRAPKENTDEFCENVNREISRRLNWQHKRQGPLWARRYTDQAVASNEDVMEAFLYVVSNPMHHGLVDNPKKWPGLGCYNHVIDEKDREFYFTHYSKKSKYKTKHYLKITPLPDLKSLTRKQRAKRIFKALQNMRSRINRRQNGMFLQIKDLLEQVVGGLPKNTKVSAKAPFYTRRLEMMKRLRNKIRSRQIAFAHASYRYRMGDKNAVFPEFSFRPPTHRMPKPNRSGDEGDDFKPAA